MALYVLLKASILWSLTILLLLISKESEFPWEKTSCAVQQIESANICDIFTVYIEYDVLANVFIYFLLILYYIFHWAPIQLSAVVVDPYIGLYGPLLPPCPWSRSGYGFVVPKQNSFKRLDRRCWQTYPKNKGGSGKRCLTTNMIQRGPIQITAFCMLVMFPLGLSIKWKHFICNEFQFEQIWN